MLLNILNTHAPIIKKRIKKQTQAKWMTADILHVMHKRDRAKAMHNECEYKFWRNLTRKMIKQSKVQTYKRSVQHYHHNPKMLSNILAELCNKTSVDAVPTYLNFQSRTITDDTNIAEAFNNHFTQVAKT